MIRESGRRHDGSSQIYVSFCHQPIIPHVVTNSFNRTMHKSESRVLQKTKTDAQGRPRWTRQHLVRWQPLVAILANASTRTIIYCRRHSLDPWARRCRVIYSVRTWISNAPGIRTTKKYRVPKQSRSDLNDISNQRIRIQWLAKSCVILWSCRINNKVNILIFKLFFRN